MSYTKNVYYPTSGVMDRNRANCYDAYKNFFETNAAINSRFNVEFSTSIFEITFKPKEAHLQNYSFRIWVDSSNNLTLSCAVMGLSSTTQLSKSLSSADCPFTIIESGGFFLMEFGINDDYPTVIFLAPSQTFSGDPADNSVFFSYHYQSSTYLRQGSGGVNNASYTADPMRTCSAETELYRLTRLSSIDSRYDRIFPGLYCIDGGSQLPAWGTPFKVGKETFLMVCKNICVKV